MSYTESVTVRRECAECPRLQTFAELHATTLKTSEELSELMMSGDMSDVLLDSLIEDGYTTEEAEQWLVDNADEILNFNIAELERFDEIKDTMVSLGRKMIAMCRPEGVFVVHVEPEVTICMSMLPASVLDKIDDTDR